MSATVNEIENVVHRVPLWGWIGLAGAGAVVFIARRKSSAAAAAVDPNAAYPDLTGAIPTSGGGSLITDPGTNPGQTPDPGVPPNPIPATYNESLTDVWGGNLQQLLGAMTNAPNFVSLQLPGSAALEFGNNEATYGGGNGTPLQSVGMQNSLNDALRAWFAGVNDQIRAYGDNNVRVIQAYGQNFNDALRSGNVQGANAAGMLGLTGTTPDASRGTAPGISVCASGDTACITRNCASGDTSCARRVASWWQGNPIAGWG